jgi:putative NADH-flavin reductase
MRGKLTELRGLTTEAKRRGHASFSEHDVVNADSQELSLDRQQQLMLAALAWASAFIHVDAAAHHYSEWVLYGVFFTVLAPLQVIWGGLVLQRPHDRRLLWLGGAVSVLVALTWMMSRTTGIPIGPTPWKPEAVGWHDVMATLDEVALAVAAAGLLGKLPLSVEGSTRLLRYTTVPLTIVSVLALGLAHQHS